MWDRWGKKGKKDYRKKPIGNHNILWVFPAYKSLLKHAIHDNLGNPIWVEYIIHITIIFNPLKFPG
jgi:hypothetical protein